MLTGFNSQIAHKICASIVWSVKSLVLVALPWVVGFVRGLLSLGGGFQSSRCGLVLPEDAGIAHRSRCDGENWGAGLLRAWSQVCIKSSSCSRHNSSPVPTEFFS